MSDDAGTRMGTVGPEVFREAAEDAAPAASIPLTNGRLHEVWESRARVVLTPSSPPSIIGLLGFMGATLMVGAWQADWYGGAKTGFVLWPFAAIFGGIFEGAAGSAVTAGGWWAGSVGTLMAGGVLFVISAVIAWYTATGMIIKNVTGRALLPLGSHKFGGASVPPLDVIEYPAGMPGVRVGQ